MSADKLGARRAEMAATLGWAGLWHPGGRH